MKLNNVVWVATVGLVISVQSLSGAWYTPNNGYLWSTGSNWDGPSGVPTIDVPAAINNAGLVDDTPLVIDCEATCESLNVGSNEGIANLSPDQSFHVRMIGGASLSTKYGIILSENPYNGTIQRSRMSLDGGTIINDHEGGTFPDIVGAGGSAWVTNTATTYRMDCSSCHTSLKLGYSRSGDHCDTACGEFVQNGGKIECVNENYSEQKVGRIYVGANGRGKMVVNGGEVAARIIVGHDGDGLLEWNGGSLTNAQMIYVGRRGSGTFTVSAEVEGARVKELNGGLWGDSAIRLADGCRLDAEWLKIGTEKENGSATVDMGSNSTLTVENEFHVGGYLLKHPDNEGSLIPLAGRGEVVMRGSDIRLIGTSLPQLYVGRCAKDAYSFSGSDGTIRGWGRIMQRGFEDQYSKSVNIAKISLGKGRIIADGFGSERLLDLTPVVEIMNEVTNPADGASGWYAENKGAAHYPRIWFGSGTQTYCFGTSKNAGEPDLVNSLRFSVNCATGDNHFRGGLYAADRGDVHLDELPRTRRIIGVWKLGVFSEPVTGSSVPFTDLSLTIRYDQTDVKPGDGLSLYRYAGGTWTRVGRTTVSESASTRTIATRSALASDDNQEYNAGVFALATDVKGMIILVR